MPIAAVNNNTSTGNTIPVITTAAGIATGATIAAPNKYDYAKLIGLSNDKFEKVFNNAINKLPKNNDTANNFKKWKGGFAAIREMIDELFENKEVININDFCKKENLTYTDGKLIDSNNCDMTDDYKHFIASMDKNQNINKKTLIKKTTKELYKTASKEELKEFETVTKHLGKNRVLGAAIWGASALVAGLVIKALVDTNKKA